MLAKFKAHWKKILIMLLVSILGGTGFGYYKWVTRVIPEELLPEAINKTINVDSYRYQVALKLNVNGQERLLSHVKGERSKGRFHIQGEVAAQEVDVYYVNNKVFMKDSVSGRWMINHGGEIFERDLFMIEVNPKESLGYLQLDNIVYLGIEKGHRSAYVMEYNPVVTNKMLTTYWEDFKYKVWIDKKSKRIIKLEINAHHKDNPENTFYMLLGMYDFGKRIKIEEPAN
ncbi:MAG: hypothetical protein AB1420_11340 [Bacillota bacterium]